MIKIYNDVFVKKDIFLIIMKIVKSVTLLVKPVPTILEIIV